MDILREYRKKALTGGELMKLVNNQARVITYPELRRYKTIDDVLGRKGACFLLFEARPNFGHWCCLIKRGDEIEFFNPYGGYPDDSLKYIPMHYRKISGQRYPLLSHLMDNSRYKLAYNEYKFQKYGKNINTCGRWCALRVLFRDWSLDMFANIFKNEYGDELATLLTMWVNKKYDIPLVVNEKELKTHKRSYGR